MNIWVQTYTCTCTCNDEVMMHSVFDIKYGIDSIGPVFKGWEFKDSISLCSMLHHCVTHFTPHVHVLTNLVQKQCSNCFHTYSILYSMCVVELGVVLFATLSVTEGDSCIHIYVH